jgi:hypothetical protein
MTKSNNLLASSTAGVNVIKLQELKGDDVDLTIDLAAKPILVTVDEGDWRKMGVGEETIKMVKMVGLVKNLLL